MSAKLLHALTDENPDLQKQIGCMAGIFQLFDRHHILTNKRIASHKRLPQGPSHLNNGKLGTEPSNGGNLSLSKNVGVNQRFSTESSRASFSSSSCSSSFSSHDCNKTAQETSFEKTMFPETPSRDRHIKQPTVSPQMGRHSLDFRDVVKDSIYREPQGLSVKTTKKEEHVGRVVKHRDSPRPLPLTKLLDGSFEVGINGKLRVPADLNESVRVLTKLKEAPWNFNDSRESMRSSYEAKDGSLFSIPKDAPRFSYDGREIPRSSFEFRDTFKTNAKLRELPRLSLDSREGSMRVSNSDPKSNSIVKDLRRNNSSNSNRISNSQQEPGSSKRPPGVVAKLMGLEALPNSISATEDRMGLIKTCPGEGCDPFLISSKTIDGSKQNRISSPRSSPRDSVSPRLRNPDSVVKQVSRFPIESAPWKQLDSGREFQKSAFRNQEVPKATRASNSSSVYDEIEKRLKEIEFKQSGKDLRALKQLLDAMKAKDLLKTEKDEDQGSKFVSQRNYHHAKQRSFDQTPRLESRRNLLNDRHISVTIKGTSPPRTSESPIVIMKPVKLTEKSGFSASPVIPIDGLKGLRKPRIGDCAVGKNKGLVNNRSSKELIPKATLREPASTFSSTDKKANGRNLRLTKTLTSSQHLPRENTGNSGKSSESVSPRLLQKKHELEKRSRPPIPSSDLSKPRRQSRQPTESGSPRGKLRPKSSNSQRSDDQFSEISSTTRNLSHQGDEISLRSDSSISLASQMDIEVTSADRSAEINCAFFQQSSQSQSNKVANNSVSNSQQKKPSARLSEEGSLAELTTNATEQPSPVSVLDGSFYRDDLPSPMKISNAFKYDETQISDDNPGEDEWNEMNLIQLSDSAGLTLGSDINQNKLENVENLVQNLRLQNSNHNEVTTDYIATLCENSNPDHRYISEILLASGLLLNDLGSCFKSIKNHPSGHPINPNLFFVLEQTKSGTGVFKDRPNCEKVVRLKPDQEKLHRKFVFDAVNEILVRKLALVSLSSEPWLRTNKLAGRTLNAQSLLRELCSEIEQLQANEKLNCSLDDDDDDNLKNILMEDAMHQSENWTDFHKEVSGVVLDVERSIFKDLVDEVVSSEAACLRAKTSRRGRQLLFTK